MTTKKTQNNIISNLKERLKTPGAKKMKHILRGVLYVSVFILGWSFDFFNIKQQALESLSTIPNESDNNKNFGISDTASYEFINPYVVSPVFSSIYHEELTRFNDKISSYCEKAEKDNSIEKISYYFRDMTNGMWIGINEKEKFAPASLSKVPILIAVLQKAQEDPNYLDKKLQYNGSEEQTYYNNHPEIKQDHTCLRVSSYYTIDELCEYMISRSDNESTKLLFADIGIEYLDALKKRLGYYEPGNATSASNIITVKNYSAFFRILYNASLLNREYSNKALELLSRANYDLGIRKAIPSNIVVCQKFGQRDTFVSATEVQIKQLHHAGLVYYHGKPFFICIMTKGSNKSKMDKIIYDLALITYNEVDRQVKIFKKDALLRDIN